MGQPYDISIDIDNVILILLLVGIPMWAWGARAKKRHLDNARVQWIMRIGLVFTLAALIWIIIDLLTGRLVTIR